MSPIRKTPTRGSIPGLPMEYLHGVITRLSAIFGDSSDSQQTNC